MATGPSTAVPDGDRLSAKSATEPEPAKVSARTACSDEEAERLGFRTLLFMFAIGICCFVVPRLGGWDKSAVGVSHYISVVGAACILVAGYLYLTGNSLVVAMDLPERPASDAKAAVVPRPVVGGGIRRGKAGAVPETHLAAVDETRAASGVPRRRPQPAARPPDEQQESAQDPIWDVDWANLAMQPKPSGDNDPTSPSSVEVFELNDTPTWLARMQQRREQALRAGKQKLVLKIDKEVADALRMQASEPPRKRESRVASSASAPVQEPAKDANEDIYGMDWSVLPEDTPKAVAATTPEPVPEVAAA
mmetsp:Transcript_101520/g.291362  ORF Transcript_101520/g.291362 Transcript_101520/m.291362 type:complete len:307 (-) Transcript_101520:262-1182(-)|eukprot:CAMPEP_0177197194 /NCGR_PEP_ID=MMETSP0367-20130122/24442_1 /TAXON_ID=447022 ORGANISM="Scrippsiella hangoei-like, Strain SHHI-4" /NCGR_SAMPLE_ID=MMETSP0367 /ASSEMBLY_ACC=CAM_ASM_000362 /LENGTH=306 /DNA_ID=CAMNT_0018645323 /DNA_START=90 /DNA_END=1010 /DNA_ORIENTATION=-